MSASQMLRETLGHEAIRSMLLRGVRNVIKVPFECNNYSEVLGVWRNFLTNGSSGDTNIDMIFRYHESHANHVLLYHSMLSDSVLLLARVDGVYRYGTLPWPTNDTIEIRDSSYVGVYT